MTLISSIVFTLLTANTYAAAWTVEIEDVRVWNNGKAEIFIANPRNPNPAGSTLNCNSNMVSMGNPANTAMLSLAISSWIANKKVRLTINGQGDGCQISYIQTTTRL